MLLSLLTLVETRDGRPPAGGAGGGQEVFLQFARSFAVSQVRGKCCGCTNGTRGSCSMGNVAGQGLLEHTLGGQTDAKRSE